MDKTKVIERLRFCAESDQETAHMLADDVLCELLINLGYAEVVEEYNKIPKWYA